MEHLQDVLAGNLRLFKMVYENEPQDMRCINQFCSSMGDNLISKYDLGREYLSICFEYEDLLKDNIIKYVGL